MPALTNAFKIVWDALKELGLTSAITAALLSAILACWSYVEKLPMVVIVSIAIGIFCSVISAWLFIRLYIIERKNLPDYRAWDKVEGFPIWQVACLWAKQSPYSIITPDKKAYPYLQMLKRDIDTGFLKVEQKENEIMWRFASRQILKKYAEEKGEAPPFIFPEKR